MYTKYILLLITLIYFIKLNTASVECNPPKCDDPGCEMNYYTEPCPSCQCV